VARRLLIESAARRKAETDRELAAPTRHRDARSADAP
jgi:hypothetical protein